MFTISPPYVLYSICNWFPICMLHIYIQLSLKIHHFIHLIHFSPNPILLMTENTKDHSKWSYAFSMSSLYNTASSLFFKTESKTSLATRTASRIFLPCTKAFWALETTFPTTLFNLLARTLANHLYSVAFFFFFLFFDNQ